MDCLVKKAQISFAFAHSIVRGGKLALFSYNRVNVSLRRKAKISRVKEYRNTTNANIPNTNISSLQGDGNWFNLRNKLIIKLPTPNCRNSDITDHTSSASLIKCQNSLSFPIFLFYHLAVVSTSSILHHSNRNLDKILGVC